MRLACLYVPQFPLAALLRSSPELRGEAVVVVEQIAPRGRIVAVSEAAERRGIRYGSSLAQAHGIDAEVQARVVSVDTIAAAQAALCDAAASFTPRLEDATEGLVYLDLSGLGALFESELQLAHALSRRAWQLGLEAQVGVGNSKNAALLAARHGGGVRVIPPQEEWSFLAPVAISALEPNPTLAATLQRWGIRTVGDLVSLPVQQIGARLGPEGTALWHRARGDEDRPLVARTLPLHFEEGQDLDYGIDNLEPLLFVARGLLDRLITRLALRGLICGDLRLSLRLATRGRDDRTVTIAAPSNDLKALLALLRLHLESHPPAAAIEGIRLTALPERLRASQLDLFLPPGPAPAKLAVTLARLSALCGSEHVRAPALADSYRPDAYQVEEFRVQEQQAVARLGGYAVKGATTRITANRLALALRALRPPHEIEVFCNRDRPDFVRGPHFAGRVVQAAGPWRVHGEWWSEGAYLRDYYDASLSDGGVYRLYYDVTTRRWFADAQYD